MGFLKKLFGKRSFPSTRLSMFLERISLEKINNIYYNVKEESMRLPSTISIIVLYFSHKFCEGLFRHLEILNKKMGNQADNFPYDVITFEVAAYCHFWLLKEYLLDDSCDEYGLNRIQSENYNITLVDALHLTNGLIRKYTDFDLNEKFFIGRTSSYSGNGLEKPTLQSINQQFERILTGSIIKRIPIIYGEDNTFAFGIEGGLSLDIAIKTYIPIFYQAYIPTLRGMALDLFKRSISGALDQ